MSSRDGVSCHFQPGFHRRARATNPTKSCIQVPVTAPDVPEAHRPLLSLQDLQEVTNHCLESAQATAATIRPAVR